MRITEIQFPVRAKRFVKRELPLSPAAKRIGLLCISGNLIKQRVRIIKPFLRKIQRHSVSNLPAFQVIGN